MKQCRICHLYEPEIKFRAFIKDNKTYYKLDCTKCEHKKRDPIKVQKSIKKTQDKEKYMRKNNIDTYCFIYKDSKKSDKRHNRDNNLTKSFIADMIKNGCSYCGETKLRMTLDRIDNAKGHTQDNVAASCIRCNLLRGSMPYEPWLIIAKTIRYVVEKNLFGNWVSNRVKISVTPERIELYISSLKGSCL